MYSVLGIAIGVPFGTTSGIVTPGGAVTTIALALAEDIKVYALLKDNKLPYTLRQKVGIIYNLEV